jgi:hypothetical protein
MTKHNNDMCSKLLLIHFMIQTIVFSFVYIFLFLLGCVGTGSSLLSSAVGMYNFESTLGNSITSGSPFSSLTVVGSSTFSYGSTLSPSGSYFNTINGYLQSTSVQALTDFTYSM